MMKTPRCFLPAPLRYTHPLAARGPPRIRVMTHPASLACVLAIGPPSARVQLRMFLHPDRGAGQEEPEPERGPEHRAGGVDAVESDAWIYVWNMNTYACPPKKEKHGTQQQGDVNIRAM